MFRNYFTKYKHYAKLFSGLYLENVYPVTKIRHINEITLTFNTQQQLALPTSQHLIPKTAVRRTQVPVGQEPPQMVSRTLSENIFIAFSFFIRSAHDNHAEAEV